MYQYHVKIIGEKDPIILEEDRGRNLKESWDNHTIGKHDRIKLGDKGTYTGDQIKGIKVVKVHEEKPAIEFTPEDFNRVSEFVKTLTLPRKYHDLLYLEHAGAIKITNLERGERNVIDPKNYLIASKLWSEYTWKKQPIKP